MSPTSPTRRRDRGSVLPMTLVFLMLGSMIVMALLSFASTVFRNRPPLEERSDSFEAVRSGMTMAVTMQRAHGPEGCFPHPDGYFAVNGRTVNVTCTVLDDENDLGGRYGLLATTNTGNTSRDGAAVFATGSNKRVRNGIFVNGGSVGAGSAPIEMLSGTLDGSTSTAAGLSAYRYATLDPTGAIDVSATPSCGALFGPAVQEVSILGPDFLPVSPVLSVPDVVPATQQVELTGEPGTRVLGAIVLDTSGAVLLQRDVQPGGIVQATATAGSEVSALQVCVQSVSASDPTYVPEDRTFCGSPLMDPEQIVQASDDGMLCDPRAWWEVAGWKPDAVSPYIRPMLPQIPTYQRSTTPRQVGSSNCYVMYPGRYQGEVVLDGNRDYYFASGVYLFDSPVRVNGGARVVGGEGKWAGCTFDAEASFLPGSPLNHEITGKGVTFLLGDDALLDVDDASVRLNERIATTSTRATSGINVMSVNTAVSTPELIIPSNDRVLLPGCLASEVAGNPSCAQNISSYSATPVAGGDTLTYSASNLGHDDTIVDVELDGASRATNRVLFGGAVYVPNAAISVSRSAGGDAYDVGFYGGATATTFDFDLPTGGSDRFAVGEPAALVYQRVRLDGWTTFDDRTYRSSVVLEVDDAERYAINSWTITADNPDTPPPTTAPPTTAPPTTAAPTTTVPTGPTTAPPTTAPPTTAPPTTAPPTTAPPSTNVPPFDICANGSNWTHDFGSGSWRAEFWNHPSFSGNPPSPFVGPPDVTTTDTRLDDYWGSGSPSGVQGDHFTGRFTRTVNVANDCTVRFRAGADDGYRLFVDGSLVTSASSWSNHSHQSEEVGGVTLTAGEYELVFEFYEDQGSASYELEWRVD